MLHYDWFLDVWFWIAFISCIEFLILELTAVLVNSTFSAKTDLSPLPTYPGGDPISVNFSCPSVY